MLVDFCLTTFNRPESTIEAFKNIIDDPRINSVIIVDDASEEKQFQKMIYAIQACKDFQRADKIMVYRNKENLGMSRNKAVAISKSKLQWAIIGDSDNTFRRDYLDAIDSLGELSEDTIYCPSQARPNFIFEKFAGRTFDRHTVKELSSDPMGNCSMNCCNYLVPVKAYGEVYEYDPEMKATDTVYMSWLWLKAGYKFHIVKGMGYEHKNHEGSGFLQDLDYNMKKSEEVRRLILSL